jgi:hypothetical protein
MISKIFGILCGMIGLGFIVQEVWTMALFGLPGKSSEGSGFYIILGLAIVMLAAVILFYNNKEEDL